MTDWVFADRKQAGHQLAAVLTRLADEAPLVLALPRGGVPVAFEVARALGAPLDVLLVRKIGAPGCPELGLGAVVDGTRPQIVLNESVIASVRPPAGYVDAEAQRQLAEIERRRRLYRGERAALPVQGRSVIVIDDGIATGGTMKAALRALGQAGALRRVLAVPVAPRQTLESLTQDAEEVVCLFSPEPFRAVGEHYADFRQVDDDEVVALLRGVRSEG